MEYVLIGFGVTRVFEAASRSEAIDTAHRLAASLRLCAWLLYDRASNLIAEH